MTNILGYPRKEESTTDAVVKAMKAKRGKPDGFVGTDPDGYATLEQLGSGTPSSGVYLRGDGTWAAASGSGLADGDYGDVTVSGSSTALTVDAAGGITFVKTPLTGTGLQTLVNSLTTGGRIVLGPGTHYADAGTPSTPLTLPATVSSVIIEGLGSQKTKVGSPVLVQANKCTLRDMLIEPGATAYGIKLEDTGTFISHTRLDNLVVSGATTNIIVNNTVILTCATNCSFEFATGAALTFPGSGTTTTTFINCAFTQSAAQAVLGVTSAGLSFRDCNFESPSAVCTSFIDLSSCQNVVIDRCNFEVTGGTVTNIIGLTTCIPARVTSCHIRGYDVVTRAVFAQNSPHVVVDNNRIAEFTTNPSIILDSSCVDGSARNNIFVDPNEFARLDMVDADMPRIPDIARVSVSKNSGSTVGSRRRLNLIEGSGVTLTVADDSANEEVDVTIAAASGSGNSVTATVDFGSTFSYFASVVVTGQTWVASGSEIVATVLSASGKGMEDAVLGFSASVSDLVAGTGFTLNVYAPNKAQGTYTFSCVGV